MGMMDEIKKAQEMAQQAQQAAGVNANQAAAAGMDQGDIQAAQLAQKIATSGQDATGTIKSISETGKTDAGVNKQYAIEVTIDKDGESYDTTILQSLTEDALGSGHYEAGKRFNVKVDPDDKTQALMMGPAD